MLCNVLCNQSLICICALHRTYVFNKLLPQPSQILTATMPRPLGIVFEFDERRKRVVVADFIEGSNADRMAKVRAADGAGWAWMGEFGKLYVACCADAGASCCKPLAGLAGSVPAAVSHWHGWRCCLHEF